MADGSLFNETVFSQRISASSFQHVYEHANALGQLPQGSTRGGREANGFDNEAKCSSIKEEPSYGELLLMFCAMENML